MSIRDRIIERLLESPQVEMIHKAMKMVAGPQKSKGKFDDHSKGWKRLKDKDAYDKAIYFHKNQAASMSNGGKTKIEKWSTKDGHEVVTSHHHPFPSVHKVKSKDGEISYHMDTVKRSAEKHKKREEKTKENDKEK